MEQEKKSFFKDRSTEQIKELRTSQIYSPVGLIERVININQKSDVLELRFPITPLRFRMYADTWEEASRKAMKHGDYINLNYPQTLTDALKSRRNPLSQRVRDLSHLTKIPEEKIEKIGYSFSPVFGRDRRKRLVPFVWNLEAARLYTYSEKLKVGIEVQPYADALRVSREGASVVVKVPSRTKKKNRYTAKIDYVPIENNEWKRPITMSLVSTFNGKEPEHSTYNIRYTFKHIQEGSDVFTFYPHPIAAYWSIVKYFMEKEDNIIPWQMDQFAKPSQKMVDIYKKFCNNIIIYDPTLKSKDKRRKLHVDEKSILIARAIGVLGHDETMFWDPKRDPKTLKDYDWKI